MRDLTLAAYEEYAVLVSEGFWLAYRSHLLDTLDSQGPEQRIVAEQDGELVGSVLLFPAAAAAYGAASSAASEWPEVRLLAVAPAARGRGIGERLMRECARRACDAGAAALALHTTDVMRAAMRLYERMGFVRAPEMDFAPGGGIVVKGYRLDLRRAAPDGV